MRNLKSLVFGLVFFVSVVVPAVTFAAVNPTTEAATGITTNDATLNGTNGDTAASQESFWVSLSGPIDTSIPVMPPGVYSTPVFPGVAAGATFSAPLSLVTTSGIPSNLPPITPGTTYYYVAWANVGGTWYPGTTQSFTTLPLPPQTITPVAIPAKTYGDADFDPAYTGGASGNPVTYTSTTPSVCSVVLNQIHIVSAGSCTFNADQAGNGSYSAAAQVPTTITIAPKTITLSATVANKVYDGNTTASLSAGPVFTGLVGVETLAATSTFADNNVATNKAVSFTLGDGTGFASNYTLTNPMLTANITPRTLNYTAVAVNKTYDGTTVATITLSDDRILAVGDTFVTTANATFADKHVGVGKTVTINSTSTDNGPGYNNYVHSTPTPSSLTADITPLSVTVTALTDTKVYDGTTSSSATPSFTALGTGDTGAFTQTFDNPNVAGSPTKTLTPAGLVSDGNSGNNYTYIYVPVSTGTITPKNLTTTGTTVTSKVYDKTTSATLNFGALALVGVVAPDVVTLDTTSASGTYDNFNVGINKVVTVTGLALAGIPATINNYTLSQPTGVTGTITARPITVRPSVAATKVYDGNASSAGIPTVTVGSIIAPDTENFTQAYANKNVGTSKAMNASGVVNDGNGGNNYAVTFSQRSDATITAAPLTVTATGVNKVYNGNTAATVVYNDNRVPGDILTISGTATFDNKNVGVGKTVSVTGITKSGTDANNYTLTNTTATTTANITARALNLVFTATGKVYNGNTVIAPVTHTGDDRVAGDIIGVTPGAASFSDKNVGATKTVVLAPATIFGPDAGNYTAVTPATLTAPITAAPLTLSFTASNKVYDGTTTATIATRTLTGVIGADVVTASGGTATFNTKHVGNSKVVTGTGFVLGGIDGGNYTVTTINTTTANITARPITVTAQANTKVYDGTTSSLTNPSITVGSIASGDSSVLSQTYNNRNVGTGKTLTPSIVVTDGNSGANYAVTLVPSATGVITARPLSVTAVTNTKVYDGNTSSLAIPVLSAPLIAGDTHSTLSQTYDNKNVAGSPTKTLTPAPVTITDGNGGLNYSVTLVPSNTGSITPKTITVTGLTVTPKVYDKTNVATVVYSGFSFVGVVGGDDVNALNTSGATATYSDVNVGTGKTVTVAGLAPVGNDAPNYTLTQPSLVGDITQRPITVTATSNTKVYDALLTATALPTITSGSLATANGGDTAVLAETYATKDVGIANKVVIPTAVITDGNSGLNYLVTLVNNTTSTITPRALLVSVTGIDKVYDGNTGATVTYSDDRLEGDVFTVSGTANFADKNVSVEGKTISVTNITLTGADAANYTPNETATTSADITKRALDIVATTANKVFDGNTSASTTLTATNIVSEDDVTINQSASDFTPDASVGNEKTVLTLLSGISGEDSGNYSFTSPVTSTANITTAPPAPSSGGGGGVVLVSDNAPVNTGTGQVLGATTSTVPENTNSGSASKFVFLKNFRVGSQLSPDVTELQKILIAKGYLKIKSPTGYFGSLTLAAVRSYQRANNIPATGNVYILTRTALNSGL